MRWCARPSDTSSAAITPFHSHPLATHSEASHEARHLTLQQRGYVTFADSVNYETLRDWLAGGWTIQGWLSKD